MSAMWAELLNRVEAIASSPTPFVKTVDLREYALKVIDRLDTAIDKFAKIEGIYTADKSNPADLKSVARTVAEFRQRIATDAEIYAATDGKYGYPMPDDSWIEGEERKLCETHKVLPEQLATEMGKIG